MEKMINFIKSRLEWWRLKLLIILWVMSYTVWYIYEVLFNG